MTSIPNETASNTATMPEASALTAAALKEAIRLRTSRRSYTSKPIEAAAADRLNQCIARINESTVGRIRFRLITGEPKAFSSILKTYGLFSGVHSYIVASGLKDDVMAQQLIGYYGEQLVLTATAMGLGSCWVGATCDKSPAMGELDPNGQIYCLITLGYAREKASLGEKLVHAAISQKRPEKEALIDNPEQTRLPRWFMDGINAVRLAPSARNRLPVHFSLKRGIVSAWADKNGGYENIDLGIAKLHFELGADYIFYDLRKSLYIK